MNSIFSDFFSFWLLDFEFPFTSSACRPLQFLIFDVNKRISLVSEESKVSLPAHYDLQLSHFSMFIYSNFRCINVLLAYVSVHICIQFRHRSEDCIISQQLKLWEVEWCLGECLEIVPRFSGKVASGLNTLPSVYFPTSTIFKYMSYVSKIQCHLQLILYQAESIIKIWTNLWQMHLPMVEECRRHDGYLAGCFVVLSSPYEWLYVGGCLII